MLKFIPINATSAGDNVLFAGVPDKQIKVLSYTIVANGAVITTFKSGSTNISGGMALSSSGGVVSCSAASPVATGTGAFAVLACDYGQDLILNLSAGGVQVGGHMVLYVY